MFDHKPEDRVLVYTGDVTIGPDEDFEFSGVRYHSITGAVGFRREVLPGIFVDAGMVNDPDFPHPDGAVAAVRI